MLQPGVLEPGTLAHLKTIMTRKEFSQFVLVGGTALAIQIGHRLSVDLDFFSDQKFDSDEILYQVSQLGKANEVFRNSIMIRLELDGIKIDFVHYPYPFIEKCVFFDEVKMASKQDICAMKLAAVTGRGLKKDFYDIFFLLKDFSFKQMIFFYEKKYTNRNYFQMMKSILWFDDADNSEQPVMLEKCPSWDEIKIKIESVVKEAS